jgi:hypothetical protein
MQWCIAGADLRANERSLQSEDFEFLKDSKFICELSMRA